MPDQDRRPEGAALSPEAIATLPALFQPSPLTAAPAAPPDDRQSPSPGPVSEAGDRATGARACPAANVAAPPSRRAEIRPLAPARYSLHVTISEETHGKLRRAQDLLRHVVPSGDPAVVLDRALTLLVGQLEKQKVGAPSRDTSRPATAEGPWAVNSVDLPRKRATPANRNARTEAARQRARASKMADEQPASPGHGVEARTGKVGFETSRGADGRSRRSRYIPAAVRRAVWERDQGRCAHVAPNGTRCGQTGGLEFHHRVPFADGGASTAGNLSLACVRHNRLEAEHWFREDLPAVVHRPASSETGRPRSNFDQSKFDRDVSVSAAGT